MLTVLKTRVPLMAWLLALCLLVGFNPSARGVYTDPPATVEGATPAGYQRPGGKLVPPKGALFGAHVGGQAQQTIAAEQSEFETRERDIRRAFDIHNYYYTFD